MTDQKVWFITGASRGLGVEVTRAALAAGHHVVATGRNRRKIQEVVGAHERLAAVTLDITDAASAAAAVAAATAHFGRINVLVNNAGNFQAGFFEELTDAQFRAEMEVNFFGTLNVTRAVLPVLRAQRAGHIVTMSSSAGVAGGPFETAYAASKGALDIWMEGLASEVAQFGIGTTIVEPGMFRTDLLVDGASALWAELSVDDYTEQTAQLIPAWSSNNGRQPGDPAKLARAIVGLVDSPTPPLRFVAGKDGVERVTGKVRALQEALDAHSELSISLDHDD